MANTSTLADPFSIARAHAAIPARPPCRIETIQPSTRSTWKQYVENHADSTIGHTLAWHDAIRETFGHESIYLLAMRKQRCVGVLPLFCVNSWIMGKLLVSVPYGVGGGILADDDVTAAKLFDYAQQIAQQRSCRSIDLRSRHATLSHVSTLDDYAIYERTLPDRAEEVLAWLPRKARAAARNGRNKYALQTVFGDEHLREVWNLYSQSMRRLASISYPYKFFQSLIKHTPGRHWVTLIKRDQETVAGLVTLLYRDRVMPYFIGATDSAKKYSAANFAYLSLMERGVANGYRIFDFGRTRIDNAGSSNFKRFHGFEPKKLGYQRLVLNGQAAPKTSPTDARYKAIRSIWPMLPLSMTRMLGRYVSPHLTG